MSGHAHRTRAVLTAVLVVAAIGAPAAIAGSPPPPGSPAGPIRSAPPRHRIDLDLAGQRVVTATAQPAATTSTSSGANLLAEHPDAASGDLWIYPNNGATSGNPWTTRDLSGSDWRFADVLLVGDVTGDGQPDVVARDPSAANGTLWIYPNNGATSGNPWTTRYSAGTGWNFANELMLGDVTGDGRADIVARDPAVDQGTMWVYPSTGATGANPFPARFWAGTGWNLASALVLGDANGDGHADVVIRDDSGALWIYPSNGSSNNDPWTSRYGAGTGWNLADALLLGDVTGDGHADLVARDSSGALWVYPGNGSPNGNPWTIGRSSAGTGWQFADTLVLADVTGDGHPDLLARPGGDLWLYPNNGSATTSPWTTRIAAGTGWAGFDEVALGDVTGDGHPDLVARNPAVDNGTLWIYPGNGSTTTDPWTATPIRVGTGWNLATSLLIGDLTGDGHPDILVRDTAGNLWIYPSNGSATGDPFTVSRIWAGTGWNTATALALGDLNRDGVADLIDQEQDGSMWIYLAGASGPPIRVDGDWSSTDTLLVADVEGTGQLDLVTRDRTGALWIYPNNGSTAGNPWTSVRPAGTGWQFASLALV